MSSIGYFYPGRRRRNVGKLPTYLLPTIVVAVLLLAAGGRALDDQVAGWCKMPSMDAVGRTRPAEVIGALIVPRRPATIAQQGNETTRALRVSPRLHTITHKGI